MTSKNVLFIINEPHWRRALKKSKVVAKIHYRIVSDCQHAIRILADPMVSWHLVVTQETTDDLRQALALIVPQPPMIIITRGMASNTAVTIIGELEAMIKAFLET